MPRGRLIKIRKGNAVPTPADFEEAEPAWDSTGKRLYVKAADGTMSQVGAVEGIALVCSEIGETVAARLNHKEKAVDRACAVVRVTWELAPTSPSTSGSSQAMLYARRSGIKTPLLTANASLPVTTGIFTDVSGTLTGTLTLAAGDTLGVDLSQVGTGASGLILTAYVRYS